MMTHLKNAGISTGLHYPIPVSYTHLDVYKRQLLPRHSGF